jgi:hypothetical protein
MRHIEPVVTDSAGCIGCAYHRKENENCVSKDKRTQYCMPEFEILKAIRFLHLIEIVEVTNETS